MANDDDSNIIDITDHPKKEFFRPGRFEVGGSKEECTQCGGPMVARPLKPYPVVLQVLFGLNFMLLVVFFDRVQSPMLMWPWTAVQVLLGILLARGRKLAKQRVFVCVRCSAELP